MISFVKNCDLITIRKKIIVLYFLNVTDIIFTLGLLQTGLFKEANVFMVNTVESPLLSIIIKIMFPAALLCFLYKRICNSDKDQLRTINIALLISLTMYCLVNITHIIWIVLLALLW